MDKLCQSHLSLGTFKLRWYLSKNVETAQYWTGVGHSAIRSEHFIDATAMVQDLQDQCSYFIILLV